MSAMRRYLVTVLFGVSTTVSLVVSLYLLQAYWLKGDAWILLFLTGLGTSLIFGFFVHPSRFRAFCVGYGAPFILIALGFIVAHFASAGGIGTGLVVAFLSPIAGCLFCFFLFVGFLIRQAAKPSSAR